MEGLESPGNNALAIMATSRMGRNKARISSVHMVSISFRVNGRYKCVELDTNNVVSLFLWLGVTMTEDG